MSKVKICGLNRMEDIISVNQAQPDYVGFVFAESRRKIDDVTAVNFKKKLDSRIKSVGVFVNYSISQIERLYNLGIIDMIQLHGNENDEYIRKLRLRCNCRIIKAVSIGESIPELSTEADYLLFDSVSAGSGVTFDWDLIKNYRGRHFFLSGGLNTTNVVEAISRIYPYCVDVSSGVETGGVKDSEKMQKFVQLARRV